MRRLRVYADTSVYGGRFDVEFEFATTAFFQAVEAGDYTLLVSQVVRAELAGAPERVQLIPDALPPESVEEVAVTAEALALQQAYFDAGVLGPASFDDALHVAVATVSLANALVSWDFRHILGLRRTLAFNGVNIAQGYGHINIITPRQIGHEDNTEDQEEGF